MASGIARRSAMVPVQVGIDETLAAHDDFTALVRDRVFSAGTTPKDAATPYVELGDSSEVSRGVFLRGGNAHEETLTVVCDRARGKMGVGEVYAAMLDALDGVRFPIDGHEVLGTRLELITVFADPNGVHMRGVCRLSLTTQTQ